MSRIAQEQIQVRALEERAVLVACDLPDSRLDVRDPLGELRSLAETAGAVPVAEVIQKRHRPDVGTYLGRGKLDELKSLRIEHDASLVIFDNDLTPSQIRNIERAVGCKIIDRSELILDIFAGRATTSAAKLQVELAQLEYTYPRLRAMWSHLGQITGGAPVGIGTRGPGEQQIEIDRRIVQRRKTMLRERLAEIHRRRAREVENRRREHWTVCLVGYTNAGKSTLFNALTEPTGGGGAYADDRLFATLTTRTRQWGLGYGDDVLLSDTVGFVRDLPHHLVASFRATLEEAIHADLLLIVIDVSDPRARLHHDVVQRTLDELLEEDVLGKEGHGDPGPGWTRNGAAARHAEAAASTWRTERGWADGDDNRAIEQAGRRPRRLLVLNKTDLLTDQSELAVWHALDPRAVSVSAARGAGIEDLRRRVAEQYRGREAIFEIGIPLRDGRKMLFVESRGEVLDRDYDSERACLRVRIGTEHARRLAEGGLDVRFVAET